MGPALVVAVDELMVSLVKSQEDVISEPLRGRYSCPDFKEKVMLLLYRTVVL